MIVTLKKKEKNQGYVNVADAGISVVVHNDTINMLRYIHPKKMVVGDQYKKVDVSVTQGVKKLGYAVDSKGHRIKMDYSTGQIIHI